MSFLGVVMWLWVIVNQVVAGFMSHQWYKQKFKEYPTERKAVLPFLV